MVGQPEDRQRRRCRPLLRGVVATSAAIVVATGLPLAPADPPAPGIEVTTVDLVGAFDGDVAVIARSGSDAESAHGGPDEAGAAAASQAPSPKADVDPGAPLPAQTPAGFAAAVTLAEGSESVVFDWDSAPEGDIVEFEIRSHTEGRWSPWVEVGSSYEEAPDDAPAPTSAGPVWVGPGTESVEVRLVGGSPTGLRLHALDLTTPDDGGGFAIGSAEAAPGAPGIRPASQWGSEGWVTENDGCGARAARASTVDYAIVHHTVTTNDYSAGQAAAQILSVYWQHVNANGWCDIAYNFLVDRFGQVWEGRSGGVDRAVVGGHARGFNTASTGVALLGQYQPGASPSAASTGTAQRDALRRLLGWKLGLHGVDPAGTVVVNSRCTGSCRYSSGTPVRVPTITSHRAVGLTACPGDNAEGILAGLRPLVANDVVRTPPFPLPTWQAANRGPSILTLDAFGGVHPNGSAAPVPTSIHFGTRPVARAMTAQGGRGYVMDDFGGLHPFGGATPVRNGPYWPGWAITRDVTSLAGDVGSGYVLDAWGGVHPFGAAPPGTGHTYFPRRDIARAIVSRPAGGGYVLDGYGGVHRFGGAPAATGGPYWPGRDIARDLALRPDGRSGYVMTGSGTVHPFGGAPPLPTTWTGATASSASGMTLTADGTGGWVTDVDGVLHPFGSADFVAPAHTFALTRAGRSVVLQ